MFSTGYYQKRPSPACERGILLKMKEMKGSIEIVTGYGSAIDKDWKWSDPDTGVKDSQRVGPQLSSQSCKWLSNMRAMCYHVFCLCTVGVKQKQLINVRNEDIHGSNELYDKEKVFEQIRRHLIYQ